MTGNLIVDALIFGVAMAAANYFVLYKAHEGRMRKSILGGMIAAVIFGVIIQVIG